MIVVIVSVEPGISVSASSIISSIPVIIFTRNLDIVSVVFVSSVYSVASMSTIS